MCNMKYVFCLFFCLISLCLYAQTNQTNQNNNTTIIINGNVVNSNIDVTNNNNNNNNNEYKKTYRSENYSSSATDNNSGGRYTMNDEFFEQTSKLLLHGKTRSYFSFDSSGRFKYTTNENTKAYGSYTAVKTDRNIIIYLQWDLYNRKEELIMNRWSKIFEYNSKEYKATTSIR